MKSRASPSYEKMVVDLKRHLVEPGFKTQRDFLGNMFFPTSHNGMLETLEILTSDWQIVTTTEEIRQFLKEPYLDPGRLINLKDITIESGGSDEIKFEVSKPRPKKQEEYFNEVASDLESICPAINSWSTADQWYEVTDGAIPTVQLYNPGIEISFDDFCEEVDNPGGLGSSILLFIFYILFIKDVSEEIANDWPRVNQAYEWGIDTPWWLVIPDKLITIKAGLLKKKLKEYPELLNAYKCVTHTTGNFLLDMEYESFYYGNIGVDVRHYTTTEMKKILGEWEKAEEILEEVDGDRNTFLQIYEQCIFPSPESGMTLEQLKLDAQRLIEAGAGKEDKNDEENEFDE